MAEVGLAFHCRCFISIRSAFKAAGDIGLGDVCNLASKLCNAALHCAFTYIYRLLLLFPTQLRSIAAHPQLQLLLEHFAVPTQASRFS